MTHSECVLFVVLLLGIVSSFSVVIDSNQQEIKDADRWIEVEQILNAAIKDGAFPGCVALVGTEKVLFAKAFGNFTYGIPPPLNPSNPPITLETLFDMASCTKVTSTTSAIAQFYQRGQLNLETKVQDILGNQFAQNGKADIKVIHLLTHSAGFPPDPNPNYWDPTFGCPETSHNQPEENFSCQKKIYEDLMKQKLQYPINSGYIYSDLSFISLMFVVGRLARQFKYIQPSELVPGCAVDINHPATDQCFFEAYVRKHVFEPLYMKSTGFLPPKSVWKNAAPAENDTTYLHRVIQGQVSDGNAYAMGGIAGHAGLFSNVHDLYTLMHRIMFAKEDDRVFINKTTADFFVKEYNHSQSSRAIGWNTNDPTVNDEGWDLLCGDMSPRTFMHVGYTGTELCGDTDRKLITILLTNRVYPTAANTKIEDVRRNFNSAVVKIFDNMKE